MVDISGWPAWPASLPAGGGGLIWNSDEVTDIHGPVGWLFVGGFDEQFLRHIILSDNLGIRYLAFMFVSEPMLLARGCHTEPNEIVSDTD